jgi:hypothetical protein
MPLYSEPEEAVRQGLIALNVLDLNEDTCVKDLDNLYASYKEQGKTFYCWLVPGGGNRDQREPYRSRIWQWRVFGFILISYEGDSQKIEDDIRIVYDTLGTFLEGNETLGDTVDKADIVSIDPPERADINDDPFMWIGFVIEIWARKN